MLALFRTDASIQLGGGHLMRCLALAGTLDRLGYEVGLACTEETVSLIPKTSGFNLNTLILEDFSDIRSQVDAIMAEWPEGVDWLIVDHYNLDIDFEHLCRPWAENILVIDDLGDRSHDCDLLLNSNLGVTDELYESVTPLSCKYLLGPSYALLRPEFGQIRMESDLHHRKKLERVLVSFGLTDPTNVSEKIIDGINLVGFKLIAEVTANSQSQYKRQLSELSDKFPDVSIYFDTTDMVSFLTRCDLVIGAAGSSAWERCCLGVPSLIVHVSDNQIKVAEALSENGAAIYLGAAEALTKSDLASNLKELKYQPQKLQEMSASASRICDGRGCNRVAMELFPGAASHSAIITLRPARLDDGDLMLKWQNVPAVRRYSRNPQPLERKKHFSWLKKKLSDRLCLFNVILKNGEPVGLIRLDRRELDVKIDCPHYEISILVSPENVAQGIGRAALHLARRLVPEALLFGEVLESNFASKTLFLKAGFSLADGIYVSPPVANYRAT